MALQQLGIQILGVEGQKAREDDEFLIQNRNHVPGAQGDRGAADSLAVDIGAGRALQICDAPHPVTALQAAVTLRDIGVFADKIVVISASHGVNNVIRRQAAGKLGILPVLILGVELRSSLLVNADIQHRSAVQRPLLTGRDGPVFRLAHGPALGRTDELKQSCAVLVPELPDPLPMRGEVHRLIAVFCDK